MIYGLYKGVTGFRALGLGLLGLGARESEGGLLGCTAAGTPMLEGCRV